jgi:hypothetical protein
LLNIFDLKTHGREGGGRRARLEDYEFLFNNNKKRL